VELDGDQVKVRQVRELLPSHLLGLAIGPEKIPLHSVSVDTETSGLRTDEGARISTVSIAWLDPDRKWEKVCGGVGQVVWPSGIMTYREEVVVPGEAPVPVVSFAWPFDQGVDGTGKPEDRGDVPLWTTTQNLPLSEWNDLLRLLEIYGARVGLDFQNAKFDLHMFRAGVRRWPAQGLTRDFAEFLNWDTQNGNDLLFGYLPSTSLKGPGTATEHLWGKQESDEKQVISKYLTKHKLPKGRWDLMPWDVIAKYADQDARLTARLKEVHWRKLVAMESDPSSLPKEEQKWFARKGGNLMPVEAAERRMDLTRMLYRMEKRGVPFAPHLARQWATVIQTKARQKAELLPFRPATLPTAKHFWFGEGENKQGVVGQGFPPLARTPSGAPSLTADDLDKLVAQGLPGAEDWRSFSKLQRLDSLWYTGWAEKAGPDGRLRTSVRQNGTASGRFSVEGIQLQAIPHDYKLSHPELEGIPTPRGLIGAGVPVGWELWECDLANAEARVAALLAGCTRMLEMIEAGADLHGETARELFNVKPEDTDWGKMRQVAKRGNFSLIFGVGWITLQADIAEQTGILMSEHETKSLISAWRALYPEYGQAIKVHDQKVMARYEASGKRKISWIDLNNGERRWFNKSDIEFFNPQKGRVEKSAHKAFNQRVQANLAQFGIEMWMGADGIVQGHLTPEELETGGIVLTVHDSIVLLLPRGRAEQIIREIQQFVVELWSNWFTGVPGGLDASRWEAHS
jgi:hypothetical protein